MDKSKLANAGLVTIATFSLILGTACASHPRTIDFQDYKSGYSIEYPETWKLEANALNTKSTHSTNLWAPQPLKALVVISVYYDNPLTGEDAARAILTQCRDDYENVAVLLNKRVGTWDWCLNISYKDPAVGVLQDAYYYKKAGNRLYEVQTTGQTEDYQSLGLEQIMDTFHLIIE
jgi:hypothetical protein